MFRQALRELGYVEGKKILFEYRDNEGNRDRVPGIVAELGAASQGRHSFLHRKIVIREAKQATKTIPIVMAKTVDPVALGLVDSLARPGANITGLMSSTRDLSGKRLELLTGMILRPSRLGILSGAGSRRSKIMRMRANLKVLLKFLKSERQLADLPKIFQVAVKERVSAIITTSVPLLSVHRKQIADLAVQNRLPLMSESVTVVEAGGLASTRLRETKYLGARLLDVDKILKGPSCGSTGRAADEIRDGETKFQDGKANRFRRIPESVLAKVDKVIK